MSKTLKCNRCKDKYRIFPVALDGVKHWTYNLYKENKNLKFWQIQKNVPANANNIDYDKKGRVVCNCPRCHKLMVAV